MSIMKQIIVNQEQLETRVAVVEEGTLQEYYVEREGQRNLVGSIFKSRISNLEPSLQAAFVDLGTPKNAFLHYWDMVPATEEMWEEEKALSTVEDKPLRSKRKPNEDDPENPAAEDSSDQPNAEPAAETKAPEQEPAAAQNAPEQEPAAEQNAPEQEPAAEQKAPEQEPEVVEVPCEPDGDEGPEAIDEEALAEAELDTDHPAAGSVDLPPEERPPMAMADAPESAAGGDGGRGGNGGGDNQRGEGGGGGRNRRRRGGRNRNRNRGDRGEQAQGEGHGEGRDQNDSRQNENRNRPDKIRQDGKDADNEGGGEGTKNRRRNRNRNRNRDRDQNRDQRQDKPEKKDSGPPRNIPTPKVEAPVSGLAGFLRRLKELFFPKLKEEREAEEKRFEAPPATPPPTPERDNNRRGGRNRNRRRDQKESGEKAQSARPQEEKTSGDAPAPSQEKQQQQKPDGNRNDRRDAPLDLDAIPKQFPPGTEVIVQVTKGPIGTKGPRVTTNLSLAGRCVVLLPNSSHRGVSRKIESRKERERLRKIMKSLELPAGMGAICRTAGETLTDEEIRNDVSYVLGKWEATQANCDRPAPCCVFQEPGVLERTLRDYYDNDVKQIVVDSQKSYDIAASYIERIGATEKVELKLYEKARPIFQFYKLSKQIEQIFGRKVGLPSGGELVIDETEALIAIDINSGKSRGGKDHPETILTTNMEAAGEIGRQLRLRNVGGLVVVDFIDMRSGTDREKVYTAMRDATDRDRARTKLLRISKLGLMEMTRQREYESLQDALFENCPYCEGKGLVKSTVSISVEIQRRLQEILRRKQGLTKVRITVHPSVLERLKNSDAHILEDMEGKFGGSLVFRADARLHREEFRLMDVESGKVL